MVELKENFYGTKDARNVYNHHKLALHPKKLKSLKDRIISAPIYVRVKPTNACDHGCSFCSYGHETQCPVSELIDHHDTLSEEKMFEILEDFRYMKIRGVTYSGGGEPLLPPYMPKVLRKTLDYDIDLSIITNGQNLIDERAELLAQSKWTRVSLGETNPERFKKTRRRSEDFFH